MIVVTGGVGFVGSNLVQALNQRGVTDIRVEDDFTDGHKFSNLGGAEIADYMDHREFKQRLSDHDRALSEIEIIYHLGACTDTTEWDGRFMLEANFTYSKALLAACQARAIPLVYASSAAVYGAASICREDAAHERPLNVYGYSKLLFDQYVRRLLPSAQARVIGLRYFNVYGPREQHKGRMASVVYHFDRQVRDTGCVRLFGASHGVGPGEQQRDFVYVDDVVAVTLWGGTQATHSGVYNCGTGAASTFNRVAQAVLEWHHRGSLEYIPFPTDLRAAYQSNTCADLQALRAGGYSGAFRGVEEGVKHYLDWLNLENAVDRHTT